MTPSTEMNPILDFSGLPRFDVIRAEHVTVAIEALIAQTRETVIRLEAPMQYVTWDNFVYPLEAVTDLLSRAWSAIGHLNAVVDTPELRAAYNENQPKITEFWTALAQNLAIFDKFRRLQASAEYAGLDPSRKKVIENALRDFRLGGADLPQEKKTRFAEIQEKLAALSTRFAENVLDATNDYALLIDNADEMAGLPEDVKQAARLAAGQSDRSRQGAFKFTLHAPSFSPLLQYADKRALREKVYRANATKASELGEVFSQRAKWDNSQNITALLAFRAEKAGLLGYGNFAEVSLVPKMAASPAQVIDFLEDLAHRARPFAESDFAELQSFARNELDIQTLEAWDIAYASEKLRQQRYAFSELEVKQYFRENNVIDGLFRLVQTLFLVEIKPDNAPVWNPDVKFFRIEREGQLIGQFYLDLYARSGKRGGAWMDNARGRCSVAGKVQTPVAYLTCNFTAPVLSSDGLKQALFTHNEVITLFHEFGHGLHHMLTQIDEIGVSGIAGVEWDAVELPSQFMENFCWEWQVLQQMTAHVETGASLPRALFEKMRAAKNFQAGLKTLRHVEFSLIDILLHYDFKPEDEMAVQNLINEVRQRVAVLIPPDFNRFQHSFSHIFAGGYAAGYYSYKWAEVLSADAYAAFEEAAAGGGDILSGTVGRKFQQEILAMGGSRPAMESFKAFRGREPKIDALLRHHGMASGSQGKFF